MCRIGIRKTDWQRKGTVHDCEGLVTSPIYGFSGNKEKFLRMAYEVLKCGESGEEISMKVENLSIEYTETHYGDFSEVISTFIYMKSIHLPHVWSTLE
jgi:hypothetical protein